MRRDVHSGLIDMDTMSSADHSMYGTFSFPRHLRTGEVKVFVALTGLSVEGRDVDTSVTLHRLSSNNVWGWLFLFSGSEGSFLRSTEAVYIILQDRILGM